jgi:quercetin dioxygenase-like cupin family protein
MGEGAETPTPRVVTTGSPARPSRPLRPVLVDLEHEAHTLFDEPDWPAPDRNSRTLASSERFRLTLTALRRGAELGDARTGDAINIQVLTGRLAIDLDVADLEVEPGQVASIDHPTTWRARALEDSVVLLTVALSIDGDDGRQT